MQTTTFAAFETDAAAPRDDGVRLFGPGATVAEDLEPEYIAVGHDGETGYVRA